MTGPIDPTAPLSPGGPGMPPPGETPSSGRSRRLIVWIAVAALVLGGAIGVGAALLLSNGRDASRVEVATSTSVTSSTLAATPTSTAAAPAVPPQSTATPRATSAPAETAPAATTTLPRAVILAPVITQFEITPTDITCFPGDMVHPTMVWDTEHATEAALSIEGLLDPVPVPTGPSRYALNLRCIPGETPQNVVYVLTATGPGGTTSQSVTVHVTIT